jgi:alpha-tubulin suppressor-like RCC1 family protein
MVDLAIGRASVVDVAGDAVASWGRGYFGNGSSAITTSFDLVASNWSAILPSSGEPTMWEVVEIASGTNHTLVRFADGTVAGYGSNYWHQLGSECAAGCYPPTPYPSATVLVPGLTTVGEIVDIAAGENFSCVVGDDGRGRCWGSDGNGELGNGYSYGSRTKFRTADFVGPVLQSTTGACNTALPPAEGFAAIDAGDRFACARLTDGTVKCWGQNTDSQLGLGAVGAATVPCATTVVVRDDAAPLTDVVDVQAGTAHACAIDANGAAFCWGANTTRQLGNPLFTAAEIPYAVRVRCAVGADQPVNCDGDGALINVVSIDAGHTHTCATHSDGELTCWGEGGHAELGMNSTVAYSLGAVHSQSAAPALGWRSAHAGRFSTCAVDDLARLRCWGSTYASVAGPQAAGTVTTPLIPSAPYPRADICDGVDNDQDGFTDPGCDDDGDGACDSEMITVASAAACPAGAGDCSDQDAATSPAAYDWCGDGTDTNCNGIVDDACTNPPCATHADCPSEGFCDAGTCKPDHPDGTCCTEADTCEGGFCAGGVCCDGPTGCAPPSAVDDTCDGTDDNCNGQTDEDYAILGCGVGECGSASKCVFGHEIPCTAGIPGTESRDGLDNDCNGTTDDGFPADVAAPTWPAGARFRLLRAVDGEVQVSWDPAIDDVRTANYTVDVSVDGTPIGQRSTPGSLFSLVRVPLPPMTNLATISASVVACDGSDNCSAPLVQTAPYCPEGATDCCRRDGDCDDAIADTIDHCEAAVCVHETNPLYCANSAACDDADDCTFDTCLDNSCVNAAYAYCCTQASGCLVSQQALVIDPEQWFFRYDNEGNVLSMSGGELDIEQLAQDVIDAQNAPDFVRQVLQDNELLLGIDHRWLETAQVDSIGTDTHPSFIVHFRQRYDGMEVEGGEVTAVLDTGLLRLLRRSSVPAFEVGPATAVSAQGAEDAVLSQVDDPTTASVDELQRVVTHDRSGRPRVKWRGILSELSQARGVYVDAEDVESLDFVSLERTDSVVLTGQLLTRKPDEGQPGPFVEPFAQGYFRVWEAALPEYSTPFAGNLGNMALGFLSGMGIASPTTAFAFDWTGGPVGTATSLAAEAALLGRFAGVSSATARPECQPISWWMGPCNGKYTSPPLCTGLEALCTLLAGAGLPTDDEDAGNAEPHPFAYLASPFSAQGALSAAMHWWAQSVTDPLGKAPADGSADRTHTMAYRAMNIAHAYYNQDCDGVAPKLSDLPPEATDELPVPSMPDVDALGPQGCAQPGPNDLPQAFLFPRTWVSAPVRASVSGGAGPPGSYNPGLRAPDWTNTAWGSAPGLVPPVPNVGAISIHSALANTAWEGERWDPSRTIYHEYGHLVRHVLGLNSVVADAAVATANPKVAAMEEVYAQWFADVIAGGPEAFVLNESETEPASDACWENGAELFPEWNHDVGPHSYAHVIETMLNDAVTNVKLTQQVGLVDAVPQVARRLAFAMRLLDKDPFDLLESLLVADAQLTGLGQKSLKAEICDAFNEHGVFVDNCDGFLSSPGLTIVAPALGPTERVRAFNPDWPTVENGVPSELLPFVTSPTTPSLHVGLRVGQCVGGTEVDVGFNLRPKTPPAACPGQPVCGTCNVVDCAGVDAAWTPEYLAVREMTVPVGGAASTPAPTYLPTLAPWAPSSVNVEAWDLIRLGADAEGHEMANGVWELEISLTCRGANGEPTATRRRTMLFVRDDRQFDFQLTGPVVLQNTDASPPGGGPPAPSVLHFSDSNKNGVFHIDGRGGALICAPGVQIAGTGFDPFHAGSNSRYTFDAGVAAIIEDTLGPGAAAVPSGTPAVLGCAFDGYSTAVHLAWSDGQSTTPVVGSNTITSSYAVGGPAGSADCTLSRVKPIRVSGGTNLPTGASLTWNHIVGFHHFSPGRELASAIRVESALDGYLQIEDNFVGTWLAAPLPTIVPQGVDRGWKKGIFVFGPTKGASIRGNSVLGVGQASTDLADPDRAIELIPAPSPPEPTQPILVLDNSVGDGRGIGIGFPSKSFAASAGSIVVSRNHLGPTPLVDPGISIFGDLTGAVDINSNVFHDAPYGVWLEGCAGTRVEANDFLGQVTNACIGGSDLGRVASGSDSDPAQARRTPRPIEVVGNEITPEFQGGQGTSNPPSAAIRFDALHGDLRVANNRIIVPDLGVVLTGVRSEVLLHGNEVSATEGPAVRIAGLPPASSGPGEAPRVSFGEYSELTSEPRQTFVSQHGAIEVEDIPTVEVVGDHAIQAYVDGAALAVSRATAVDINSRAAHIFGDQAIHTGGMSWIVAEDGPAISLEAVDGLARISSIGINDTGTIGGNPWDSTDIALICGGEAAGLKLVDVAALEMRPGVMLVGTDACVDGHDVGQFASDDARCRTGLDGVVLRDVDEVALERIEIIGLAGPIRDGIRVEHLAAGTGAVLVAYARVGDPDLQAAFTGTAISLTGPGPVAGVYQSTIGNPSSVPTADVAGIAIAGFEGFVVQDNQLGRTGPAWTSAQAQAAGAGIDVGTGNPGDDPAFATHDAATAAWLGSTACVDPTQASMPACPVRRIENNTVSDFSIGVRVRNSACVTVTDGEIHAGSSGIVALDSPRVAVVDVAIEALPLDNPGVNKVPGIDPGRSGALELGGGMTRGAVMAGNVVSQVAASQNEDVAFAHGILTVDSYAATLVGNEVAQAHAKLVWLDGAVCTLVTNNYFGPSISPTAEPYTDDAGADNRWWVEPAADANIVGGLCFGGNYYAPYAVADCAPLSLPCPVGTFAPPFTLFGTTPGVVDEWPLALPGGCGP